MSVVLCKKVPPIGERVVCLAPMSRRRLVFVGVRCASTNPMEEVRFRVVQAGPMASTYGWCVGDISSLPATRAGLLDGPFYWLRRDDRGQGSSQGAEAVVAQLNDDGRA